MEIVLNTNHAHFYLNKLSKNTIRSKYKHENEFRTHIFNNKYALKNLQNFEKIDKYMEKYPTTFALETALGCNLRCPECAVGGGMVKRAYGMMNMNQYLILAKKIRPFARFIYLHLWGEPLLNKDIFSMVRHAEEFARTNISTNANLLDTAKAKELICSNVSEIIVSIDGVTQPVYETYRRRGDVSKAIRGLVQLARFNALRSKPANIIPQFIVFKHNAHEANAFTQLCEEIGLTPSFKAPYLRPGSVLKATGHPKLTRLVHTEPAMRANAMRVCPNARDVLTVLLDGSVVACCYDHNRLTYFGNLYKQPLDDIWTSPAYQEFRHRILNGPPPSFCTQECLLY